MRQNILVTCMLTLADLFSVLCLCWHYIFPAVVTYHRVGCPGCSQNGTSIKGFRRCYLVSFGITRQRCLNWGSMPKGLAHTQSGREQLHTCRQLIADGVCIHPPPPPPPSPPPILFQCRMTGGKPTVLSSFLCLIMKHSFCILI